MPLALPVPPALPVPCAELPFPPPPRRFRGGARALDAAAAVRWPLLPVEAAAAAALPVLLPVGAALLAFGGVRLGTGFVLDDDERRRRYVILSLLSSDGLETTKYEGRFGGPVELDFPQLEQLARRELARRTGTIWTLTSAGLELGDVLGPWLYSDAVASRMTEFDLR